MTSLVLHMSLSVLLRLPLPLFSRFYIYCLQGIKKTRVIYHGTEKTIQGDSTDEIPTDILNSKTTSDFKP
ncbi:hypothetical protein ERO13_A10G043150v2 [Gossypium hirsutum]|nr:hypothetical protein ERO13_A10G043150v2 [Gossypium hirsutum]